MLVNRDTCKRYASVRSNEKLFEIVNKTKNSNQKLRIILPEGDVCNKTKHNETRYQTIVEMECDPTIPFVKVIKPLDFKLERCVNVIRMKSSHACSKGKFVSWWNQFGLNKEIIAVILIAFGVLFVLWGNKYFAFNITVTIGLFSAVVLYFLLSKYLPMPFMAYLTLGMIFGYWALAIKEIVFAQLGMLIGFVSGNVLFGATVNLIPYDSQTVYYIETSLCTVLGAYIAKKIEKLIVVLVTSILGSYAFVRGISIFLGGFPDEGYAYTLFEQEEFKQLTYNFGKKIYLYMFAILGVFVFGVLYQFGYIKFCKKSKDKKDKKEKKSKKEKKEKEGENKEENQKLVE